MTKKVTLPADVGAAIENLQAYVSDSRIIVRVLDGQDYAYYAEPTKKLRSHFDIENISELASALVNGYTIEATPEEKVREFYVSFTDGDNDFERGVAYGIKQTVRMLGIEIEGVND